jgi:AcrR family transcriptional regulator
VYGLAVNAGLLHAAEAWTWAVREGVVSADEKKRIRRDPDTTRKLILDATEQLMVEEGYAAVSTRRVGHALGLNPATVHYYYPTTDDLFIALHRRMTDRQIEELGKALGAEDPLQAFWSFQSGWAQTALGVEFLALSNHRKAIRDVLADVTNGAREAQAQRLSEATGSLSLDPAILPPIALATILVAVGRLLTNEERVGITRGHAEVRAAIDWALAQLRAPARN